MLLNKEIGVKTVKADEKEIKMVLVKIKNPKKEMKSKGHFNIEMFEQGTLICLVSDIMKLREKRIEDTTLPFERRKNGKLLLQHLS